MLTAAKSSITILVILSKQSKVPENVWWQNVKISEHQLQLSYEHFVKPLNCILNFKVIVKSIIDPDSNFWRNSPHRGYIWTTTGSVGLLLVLTTKLIVLKGPTRTTSLWVVVIYSRVRLAKSTNTMPVGLL